MTPTTAGNRKLSPSTAVIVFLLLIAFSAVLLKSHYQFLPSATTFALEKAPTVAADNNSNSSSRQQQQQKRRISFADPSTVVQKEPTTAAAVVNDESSSLFLKYWDSEWKQKICPNHRPSQQEYLKFIGLAKEALNLTEGTIAGPSLMSPIETASYQYVSNSNNKSNTYKYVTIWKCGNNQIRFWSNNVFQPGGVRPACTVTAIRDPISHFLSGYNEIDFRWITGTKEWKTWMESTGQKHLKFVKHPMGSKIRFETFIIDILTNAVTKHWMFYHVYPMSRILNRVKLTAYLPTIHNLTHEWPKFLGKHCPGMPDHITSTPMTLLGQHESSKDPYGTYHIAKEVWRDQGPAAKALCLIHAIDYACWDDLPDGIPKFCQHVYSSPSFAHVMSY